MKAMVLQVNGKYAYVVCEDGMFIKIINNQYEAGQEIVISDQTQIYPSKSFSFKTFASLAAAFIVIFTLAATGYCFFTPFSYVTIDINPSLELSVNYFDMVIGISALNDDANNIVKNKQISLRYKNVSSAAEEIIDEAVVQGYVNKEQENPILVAVVADNSRKADIIVNQISIKIKDKFHKNNIKGDVVPLKVDKKQREEAQKVHISAGKLALIKKIENEELQKTQEKIQDQKRTTENKKEMSQSKIKVDSKIQNNSHDSRFDNIADKIKNKIENRIQKTIQNKYENIQNKENHTNKGIEHKKDESKSREGSILKEKTNDLENMAVKELVKRLKNKQTDQPAKHMDEKQQVEDITQGQKTKIKQNESKNEQKNQKDKNDRKINENKQRNIENTGQLKKQTPNKLK